MCFFVTERSVCREVLRAVQHGVQLSHCGQVALWGQSSCQEHEKNQSSTTWRWVKSNWVLLSLARHHFEQNHLSNYSTFSARRRIHISCCPPISEYCAKSNQSGAERHFWFGWSRDWPQWSQQVLCSVQCFLQQPSGCSAALQRPEASAEPVPTGNAGPDGGTVRTWYTLKYIYVNQIN